MGKIKEEATREATVVANGRSIRECAPLLQGEHVRMQCEEVKTREQKGIRVRDAHCEQVMESRRGTESRSGWWKILLLYLKKLHHYSYLSPKKKKMKEQSSLGTSSL